jgi:hypothetical protein
MVESVRFERFNKGASIAPESSAGEIGRNPPFTREELSIFRGDHSTTSRDLTSHNRANPE